MSTPGEPEELAPGFLFAFGSTDKVSKLVEQGSRNLFIEEICQFVAPGQRHKMIGLRETINFFKERKPSSPGEEE